MNILLKSAKIVNGATKEIHLKKRDILIKNGIIDKISTSIDAPPKTKIIENKNLHVSLGWIDTGVSFGEPGYEERETIENGLRTSARSGFTDVILNPNSLPLPDSSSDIVFLKNAGKGEVTNLHPLGNLTVGGKGETLAELYDMRNAGAVGFYDFKQAVANANLLKIALQYAQNFNGMILSFPLDHQIAGKGIINEGVTSTKLGLKGIPAMAEELQVSRDLFILEYTGGKLHIPTVSTADSVKLIAAAKKKGLNVTCSVAIHNIFKTDEVLEDFETNFKVLPPLRTSKDAKELIKGIKNGTIDFVTSDHTPLNIELKKVEFDHAEFGTIGLESSFGALNQLFTTEETIDMLTRGRKTFGIEVPEIKEGVKANLTFFDPTIEYTFTEAHITSSSKNSLFLNHTLKGKVLGTIANDQVYLND